MDTSQLKGRGIKPLMSLRNHAQVSAVIWLVIVLIGAPIAWLKGQSYYVAESVFQVSPAYMKNLSADKELELQSNSQYREFVNHLSRTVVRYDVIKRALDKLAASNVEVKPEALTERKFIERLQRQIYVRAVPDTYMVKIGLEGPEKQVLDVLVNGVTESFLNTTKEEQIFGAGDRLEVIQEQTNKVRKEISELENRRLQFAGALGLTTFGENTINPYDTMLAQAREKFTLASIERAHAEAALDAFSAQQETPMSAGRSLLEMRLQDNGLQALRNEVVKRSEELDRTTAGLEDQHPAKKPALSEYAAINQRLNDREREFENNVFKNVRRRLTASLQQTRQVEAEVARTLKRLEGLASEYAKSFQEAMNITREIQKREQELKDMRDRFNYLQTERSAIGFVRLVTPALPAETPQGVGKTKMALMVLVAATLVALLIPIVLDLLDRRIHTVNDAEKLMGIPVTGWQVDVVDLPTSLFAKEQSRRFASALIRDKTKHGKSVFAFTSVKSVGGVGTVMSDTAAMLHQLGKHVLIVDSNMEPAIATSKAKSKPATIGLTDYLGGLADLEDIVTLPAANSSAIPYVSIGTMGNIGLQRLDLLRSAIEVWSQQYDFVFFDLPPVLISADAELMIGLVGQVFLVLEAQSVSRGEVLRAKRLLEKLDPDAIGLFVNRIPTFEGAGYMNELIVETLTRNKFSHFMSLSSLKLRYEIMRAQWAMRGKKGK